MLEIIGYLLLSFPFLFIIIFIGSALYEYGGMKELYGCLSFIILIEFFVGCMCLGTILINQ
jgi:hypothetical protein